MKVRKHTVVGGIILLVVGALLFVYGFSSSFWLTIHDTTKTIQVGQYLHLNVPRVDRGMRVHSEYAASDEVSLYIFDEHNFELFQSFVQYNLQLFYDEIYHFSGRSQSYTFSAPKDDTYHIVLINFEDNDVSASVKILTDRPGILGLIYFFAFILSVGGLATLIGGLVLKPKMKEAPSRLLDAMKFYGRIKISELATRFKISEADIELALIELKSRGEPIKLDRETREVIYTPSKEE